MIEAIVIWPGTQAGGGTGVFVSKIIHHLRQYTCPQSVSLDPISLGFLVYIDAVCRL